MKKWILTGAWLLLAGSALLAQIQVEGLVLDARTGEPLSYASIYNPINERGSISNPEGYFQLPVEGDGDVLLVSYIGYEKARVKVQNGLSFYRIALEPIEAVLQEVEVVASALSKDEWYELIQDCRKSYRAADASARAYFELKSFVEGQQVELLEGFYQAELKGYNVQHLHLKAGRVALHPYRDNNLFVSLSSSKALLLHQIGSNSDWFPAEPLSMSPRKLKKTYQLHLVKKYFDEARDSIYVLQFQPHEPEGGHFFSGQIWINHSRTQVLKVELYAERASKHPFLPLFMPYDSIRWVNLHLAKTFREQDGQMVFNHVDFYYEIEQHSSRWGSEEVLRTASQAVLYGYDYETAFSLPRFTFAYDHIDDYRKIDAYPHNDFFWRYNDELKMHDQHGENQAFFASALLTNTRLFDVKVAMDTSSTPSSRFLRSSQEEMKDTAYAVSSFMQAPYMPWSPGRVVRMTDFKGVAVAGGGPPVPNPGFGVVPGRPTFKSDAYHFEVQVFVDVNRYADSVDVLTRTVFDPYQSYFQLEVDLAALCFFNMYFDLAELHRRELAKALKSCDGSPLTVNALCREYDRKLEQTRAQFFSEVARGTRKPGMLTWNSYLIEHLGIDNLAFFELFKE